MLPVAETPGPLPHATGAEPSRRHQFHRKHEAHRCMRQQAMGHNNGKVHRAHWRMRPRLGHSRSRVTAGFALGDSDGTPVDSGRPVATGSRLVRTCGTVYMARSIPPEGRKSITQIYVASYVHSIKLISDFDNSRHACSRGHGIFRWTISHVGMVRSSFLIFDNSRHAWIERPTGVVSECER